MSINVAASRLHASQTTRAGGSAASSGSGSFAAILNAKTTQAASSNTVASSTTAASKSTGQLDFTSMTRKDMFDWMNSQIVSGKMTLDESSAFLGMTMKISVATGQPVDMATDTTRENFIERARSGIEWAKMHQEPDLAKRLQAAVELMQRRQGEAFGV